MFIQIHTDSQVESSRAQGERIERRIRERLERFADRLTRVEVHVADMNGQRGGASDLKCSLEARVNGFQPVAVTDHGRTIEQAIARAAGKAARALDHTLGRLADSKGH